MGENKILISSEKLTQIKSELDKLLNVDRPNVVKAIQEARLQGDLSENADYDAAKNQQGEIETRIAELENIINNYTIINENKKNKTIVSIGKTVTIYDESDKETYTYEIVGEIEANPSSNKISNLSPLAIAIEGKEVGDKARVINIEKPYSVEIKKIS
ncbi:MAG: transcription elongation factor GreA [Mycoplasmataceae bacterium]|jgi:transcription elongation factor GreA|nr:transcription elongation factor GreA [Mycoplasmataceae bacterium]